MNKKNPGEILPVTRPRAAAGTSYDRLSGFYDLLTEAGERAYREAGLEMLAVSAGERVLEVGFGTGRSLNVLVQATGPAGFVCGVDLSKGMAHQAIRRISAEGILGRPGLCLADAVHLPLQAGVFAAAWMSFTLELFDTPDIPRVLGEIRRVLRVGGRLVVVSLSREGEASTARRLYEWGHMRFPALLDCRPIFVAHALVDAGYQVRRSERMQYLGMPVEIVMGVAN